ncbi:MAG: CCA tRNA nucleotidyltransferase [Acidimicrobiia bacterium]
MLARLQAVLDEVEPLTDRFRADGKRLYLVGGIVRDLLAGREVARPDVDLTTDARPEEIKQALSGWANSTWAQGERFGTIGAVKGGRSYEITTHRAEVYQPGSRHPDVAFSDAVEADLARRDFTVNAMALELTGGGPELIDPFDGRSDLLALHRLRTPLSPDISFRDDPLRMLRAARFLAGFGLEPEPALVEAVRRLRSRLEIVSAERIRDEIDKLLVVDDPSAGLWFCYETGLFEEFLPEIPGMRLEQDPIHQHKDVLAHTIAVVAKVAPRRPDGSANCRTRLAALLHDVGKPKTRSITTNGVSFHHHEVVGARMARERLQALRYPTAEIEAISRLVFLHLRFHGYDDGDGGWTDSAVRRYVRDAGELLDELNELTRCDCTTRNQRKARQLASRMDALEARIARLAEEEEIRSVRPELDGHQVMALLGRGPGPEIGQAMQFLLDLRLDEGPLGEEEAARRLQVWWQARD